jgi:hypothetical protein
MNPEVDEVFGGMSVVDRLKLISEWLPILARLEAVASAKTPHDRLLAVVALLRVPADKTNTAIDNKVLDHFERILRTPEGAALVDWFAAIAGDIK